jgi:hypothetical protein
MSSCYAQPYEELFLHPYNKLNEFEPGVRYDTIRYGYEFRKETVCGKPDEEEIFWCNFFTFLVRVFTRLNMEFGLFSNDDTELISAWGL